MGPRDKPNGVVALEAFDGRRSARQELQHRLEARVETGWPDGESR
jgi:hypothetical protein